MSSGMMRPESNESQPSSDSSSLEPSRSSVDLTTTDKPTDPYQAPAPVPDGAQDSPSILGYEILEEIGHGGMGVVYKPRQLQMNRIGAVKMLRAQDLDDTTQQARIEREAKTFAQMRHPNIVDIFDIGTSEGGPFLAMEFVDGGSLKRRLKNTGP